MTRAKVFQSGNSRAVRLPKAFALPVGEVEIARRGKEIVLRPVEDDASRVVELLCELSDAFDERPTDAPPQQRDWL
ncbi:MAG: antitoxin VapB [Bradyrhizobium sp.]